MWIQSEIHFAYGTMGFEILAKGQNNVDMKPVIHVGDNQNILGFDTSGFQKPIRMNFMFFLNVSVSSPDDNGRGDYHHQ